MNPNPDRVGEFTPRDVGAAQQVLSEIALLLSQHPQLGAIMGGWVPWLYFPQHRPEYTGSIDVDVVINKDTLTPDSYAALTKALQQLQFKEDKQRISFVRDVSNPPDTIPVDVEIMGPRGLNKKIRSFGLQGFKVLENTGCNIAFDSPNQIPFTGTTPDGTPREILIDVVSIPTFIVMKGYAMFQWERKKRKDAFDVVFCLQHIDGGPDRVARELSPKIKRHDVALGLQHLREHFRTRDDLGPTWYVEFVDHAPDDEREQDRNLAFGLVDRLLTTLGIPATIKP